VGRAHGLDGSFYVTRPVPRLLGVGTRLQIGEIVRRSGTDARPIIRVEGCSTRAAAEALNGTVLLVPAAGAPALDEREYWAHELEGCAVTDGARVVGIVRRLVELPSVEALEVALPEGGEVLVPMVGDAIRAIDIASRRVDVDMGFLGED